MAGKALTDEQASALAGRLAQEPEDLAARVKLLGYHWVKWCQAPGEGDPSHLPHSREHALWLIRNRPSEPICGVPFVHVHHDLEKASEELLRSAQTPGSPQLGSFGPDFRLAKELVERGERQAVSEYLDACRTFWKSGSDRDDRWQAQLGRGETPTFSP